MKNMFNFFKKKEGVEIRIREDAPIKYEIVFRPKESRIDIDSEKQSFCIKGKFQDYPKFEPAQAILMREINQ